MSAEKQQDSLSLAPEVALHSHECHTCHKVWPCERWDGCLLLDNESRGYEADCAECTGKKHPNGEDAIAACAYEEFCRQVWDAILPAEHSWQITSELTDTAIERPSVIDEPPKSKAPARSRPGWGSLRAQVWERDGNRCQVCQDEIPWEHYDCGHIVDRCAGGTDTLDNLLVMCNLCNQHKPVHETKDEFEKWRRDTYGYKGILIRQYAPIFGVKL